MATTDIEWTDATWNPVVGCTVVSPGCTNCYAMRMAARLEAMGQAKYRDVTRPSDGRYVWTGAVRCDEASLRLPLRWRKPRFVFVNSMSDLFHEEVPESFIRRVWKTMTAARWHTFQVLTKRPERMREVVRRLDFLPNVWLGTSVENADYLWRLVELRATPAAVRFASFEPLLGPVDAVDLDGIHWAIVGGESGPAARPTRIDWVREIRDRCDDQGVAFFFKQWGGPQKKKAGRELDGRTWDGRPAPATNRWQGTSAVDLPARGGATIRRAMTVQSFRWAPGDPPPLIEQHSKAKLTVLRSYLRAYFDRLAVNPSREEFRLDLIDGFAGGGTFTDGRETLSGTPLIMIEEAEAAQRRLNRGRSKPLRFDFRYYFTDANSLHVRCLRAALEERGWADEERVIIRNRRFEDEADSIIAEVKRRQPRAGRAIFVLDQTGFAQVRLNLVAGILEKLPAAEVILTLAADALMNHLAVTPEYVKAVAPLDLTESRIRELLRLKNDAGGRALAQRLLRDHIRNTTGATYDTPFFIRPQQSRRALWFLHLSRHPTARDVMIQRHWDISGTFEHYGSGGFGMLGWDALRSDDTLRLFRFEDLEARQLRKQLLNDMPAELHALVVEEPVTVQTMRHALANRTAARFSDLDDAVLALARVKEIDVLNAEGKGRSRTLRRLRADDRIAMPRTPVLRGLSLRR